MYESRNANPESRGLYIFGYGLREPNIYGPVLGNSHSISVNELCFTLILAIFSQKFMIRVVKNLFFVLEILTIVRKFLE